MVSSVLGVGCATLTAFLQPAKKTMVRRGGELRSGCEGSEGSENMR